MDPLRRSTRSPGSGRPGPRESLELLDPLEPPHSLDPVPLNAPITRAQRLGSRERLEHGAGHPLDPQGKRRRVAAVLVAVGVIGGVAVGGLVTRTPAPDRRGIEAGTEVGAAFGLAAAPTTGIPATTATVIPAVEVIEAPALPLPEPIPANFYAPTPEVVMGRLKIPKLGVDEPLQEGITLTAINRGPGWWPGTARPGELGNMVIGGHRTTWSKPFSRLDELVAGDTVIFAMPDGDITYEVRGVIVVPENRIGIANQTYAHVATLFACHPKGSATHRIVAKLRLLKPDGTPVDQEEWLPPVDYGAELTSLVVRGPDGQPMTVDTDPTRVLAAEDPAT